MIIARPRRRILTEIRVGQPVTTFPPATCTGTWVSGFGAGPCRTAPVAASYMEPWQGHWNFAPAGATVQPWCVQIALKATTFPAEGWATSTGFPALSFAETDEPTGTSDSGVRTVPAAPPAEPARRPTRRSTEEPLEHAARASEAAGAGDGGDDVTAARLGEGQG